MNKCIFMGRLTRDPEIRYTQSEKPVAVVNYTLAVHQMSRIQKALTCVQQPDQFLAATEAAHQAEGQQEHIVQERRGTRLQQSGSTSD